MDESGSYFFNGSKIGKTRKKFRFVGCAKSSLIPISFPGLFWGEGGAKEKIILVGCASLKLP